MAFIALFCPACVSVIIRHKRRAVRKNLIEYIFEYMSSLFINSLITQIVIVYVLGLGDIDISILNRFSFFTKYSVIALVIACLIPYAEETIRKYFEVSFQIEVKDGKEEK